MAQIFLRIKITVLTNSLTVSIPLNGGLLVSDPPPRVDNAVVSHIITLIVRNIMINMRISL